MCFDRLLLLHYQYLPCGRDKVDAEEVRSYASALSSWAAAVGAAGARAGTFEIQVSNRSPDLRIRQDRHTHFYCVRMLISECLTEVCFKFVCFRQIRLQFLVASSV
jgi:hypothetical protein